MYLAFYNQAHVGDTLLLLKKETSEPISHETKDNITRVYITKTQETVAYNVFDISKDMTLQQGHIVLSLEQVEVINAKLKNVGFDEITVDYTPKFVIGHVDTCQAHPDSDHLHLTTVSVGEENPLQIVCGAKNVAQGQLVVVAKVGAVMPSGLIIWPGELRGVASHGMLCSERELGLTQDMSKKGILVLDKGNIGEPFPM